MFNLDGSPTRESVLSQTIIDNSGLELDPERNNSLALVLYRKDRVDDYLYLTAYAGLREHEPMFGPLSWDDYRRKSLHRKYQENPLGFKAREGTVWTEPFGTDDWLLYVNGRHQKSRETFRRVEEKLLRAISIVLADPADPNVPLFPDLWFKEQLAREALRQQFQELPPGTPIKDVANRLASALGETFMRWAQNTPISIGIYLDTGEDWQLCGEEHLGFTLPTMIPGQRSAADHDTELNAFNWVGRSTRPVLLKRPMSAPWLSRLQACGDDLARVINRGDFSGMCIVPILHPQRRWCMGIILMIARGRKIQSVPAHIYLLSRLSLGVSGYLALLLPIPGFPWWPDARIERGRAIITRLPTEAQGSAQLPKGVLGRVVRDLMPTSARVAVDLLRAGHSGASVFRLEVSGEGRIKEIPRVLKIGGADVIANELQRYYRYVHNKKVGGASRIDIARSFVWPERGDGDRFEHTDLFGAIVYTFVGAGDQAIPWSDWVTWAPRADLKTGLEMLRGQLSSWISRQRVEEVAATVVDLMLKPLVEGDKPLQKYLHEDYVTIPSFNEVKEMLHKLSKLSHGELGEEVPTCIVHDDLHSDNVFAILSSNKQLRGVALIDWGNVTSGRHRLSDISKLMVDIAYRIDLSPEMRDFAFTTVKSWGAVLGCRSEDWKVALIHQIAKLMFYKEGSNELVPYISDEARLEAWEDLKRLAGELMAVK